MRSILRSLVPIALVLAVAGCKEDKNANEKRVVILFTTDEHSQLYASSPELDDFLGVTSEASLRGGVERRMTIFQQQRDAATAAGKATLTLSSGDFSQGSLASAAWLATSPELASMKLMGYDAVALGNHEFDLPPAALKQAILSATSLADHITPQRPQLVLSNFDPTTSADLAGLYGPGQAIAPYVVLTTSNGLRIGIVASMGVGAGTVAGSAPANAFWAANLTACQGAGASTSPACTAAKFGSVAAQVQAAVNTVRGQGVDAVILLGHGGISADTSKPGEDELLALQLKGVDLVLSGHSHLNTPEPRIVYGSGTAVPVVQPLPYGRQVGKVELVFRDDGSAPRPFLDPNGSEFIDVSAGVAKATGALVDDLHARTIGFLEYGIDGVPTRTLPSFLENTLSKILGTTVSADPNPANAGHLWNFPLSYALTPGPGCKLTFDVTTSTFGESNALNLDADAIRAAANELAPTEIGAQAFGPLRGGLLMGASGEIAFADVYHMAPLGGDPTVPFPDPMDPVTNPVGVQTFLNDVPGYPLVRFNVPTVALRAVYELTLQYAYGFNGDFFLGASGLEVHYDPTKLAVFNPAQPMGPGAVTYMALADGTVLYDVSNTDPYWVGAGHFNPAQAAALRSIATTYYVAGFASSFGLTLYDDTGHPYGRAVDDCPGTPPVCGAGPLANAVLVRNGSHVKDPEAIARFVLGQCAVNNGTLPAEYERVVPHRICMGACPPAPAP